MAPYETLSMSHPDSLAHKTSTIKWIHWKYSHWIAHDSQTKILRTLRWMKRKTAIGKIPSATTDNGCECPDPKSIQKVLGYEVNHTRDYPRWKRDSLKTAKESISVGARTDTCIVWNGPSPPSTEACSTAKRPTKSIRDPRPFHNPSPKDNHENDPPVSKAYMLVS